MARFRVSGPARADLAKILATSLERWGEASRTRYAALLAAAMRTIAAAPDGPLTRDRAALSRGLRSFHVRHARNRHGVSAPVHVIYYRAVRPGLIEVVRALHERMEPSEQAPAGTRRRTRRPPRRR
jgi:toxin ParE1/3/4